MAREGLIDDTGVNFDSTPPCEQGEECKHMKKWFDAKGELWCECDLAICEENIC